MKAVQTEYKDLYGYGPYYNMPVDRMGETVWIFQRKGSYHNQVFHTDPECPEIKQSDRDPVPKDRETVEPIYRECKHCSGEADFDYSSSGRAFTAHVRNNLDPADVLGEDAVLEE